MEYVTKTSFENALAKMEESCLHGLKLGQEECDDWVPTCPFSFFMIQNSLVQDSIINVFYLQEDTGQSPFKILWKSLV